MGDDNSGMGDDCTLLFLCGGEDYFCVTSHMVSPHSALIARAGRPGGPNARGFLGRPTAFGCFGAGAGAGAAAGAFLFPGIVAVDRRPSFCLSCGRRRADTNSTCD